MVDAAVKVAARRGRPPGSKNKVNNRSLAPGRPPGSQGYQTRAAVVLGLVTDEMCRQAVVQAGGLVPIVYLAGIMGDAAQPQEIRVAVATSLLPYFHRRKATEVEIDIQTNSAVFRQLELVYGVGEGDNDGGDLGESSGPVHSVQG